jgi:hypothetical protein
MRFSRASSRLLVLTALLTGPALVAASAPGSTAAAVTSKVPGGQVLQQAWTIGASVVWTWTHGEDTNSPQGIELTVNGGKTWADVTPRGLRTQTGDRFITGFYALDASHAWVTYGGVAESDRQTIAETSDGGRRWSAVSHEPPSPWNGAVAPCSLDFVTPKDGWCEATPVVIYSYEAVYLYRTTDGGKRWKLAFRTPLSGPTPAGSLPLAGDKNIQFASRTTGWAVMDSYGKPTAPLYETLNGGRTWIKRAVADAPGQTDSGAAFAGQPLVRGGKGAVGYTMTGLTSSGSASGPADGGSGLKSVVYVTTDNGAAWHSVTPPGTRAGWVVDAITPVSWRLVQGDHILATDNAGRSWRTITSNVSFDIYYSYDDPTAPVVNFASSRVGWIVTSTSLWRTVNGGSIWRKVRVPGT